ncbi:hypothetical protein Tco_0022107, partial [Tanacetum coccineum]
MNYEIAPQSGIPLRCDFGGVTVLDVLFYSIPPLFIGERVETELGELIAFHTVIQRYVIVKDLYQKPFLYSMMGDQFDQVLETDPGVFSSTPCLNQRIMSLREE